MADRSLYQKIPFPKEFSVLKVVVMELIDFAFMNSIFVLLLVYYMKVPTIYYLYLPVLILLIVIFTIGLAFLFGTLNVFIRDFGILTGTLSRLWFWATPVIFFFPTEGPTKILYYINPLAGVIYNYRQIIAYDQPPEFLWLTPILVAIVVFFLAGYRIFLKNERYFVDVI